MAKLRAPQKAQRLLELLMGIGHPRVRRALADHGFTKAQLDEGWRRLRALAEVTVLLEPELASVQLVRELDAWENRWYPIAEVVLRTNHPRVHAVVFANLRQTQGSQVVISVSTLLDRLSSIALPEAEGGLGDDGRAALKLLAERGLDEQVVGQARALLGRVGAAPEASDGGTADGDTRARAEQHMWNWYLEWSGIARVAIQDRRVLASLGFQRRGRTRRGEDE